MLAAITALIALGGYFYLQMQAALPPALHPDPRALEYKALQRLAAELSKPVRDPIAQQDEESDFRVRQIVLERLRAYVNASPFQSEVMLVSDRSAWTEAWRTGPRPRRLNEGLSGDPTWIIGGTTLQNGAGKGVPSWSLQVRSLDPPAPPPDAHRLRLSLLGLVLSTALAALLAGMTLGWRSGRRSAASLTSPSHPAWDAIRTDLGPLDDAMSDHMRLRGQLARESEELAAITQAVRQRRERRQREHQREHPHEESQPA
jgi:hypothetical protein